MSKACSGEKNGMFGKKHNTRTRKKQSLAKIGKKDSTEIRQIKKLASLKRWSDPEYCKTQKLAIKNAKRTYVRTTEHIQHLKENHADISGKNNPMYGKGYLIAGEKNGMYGKSAMKDRKHREKTKEKQREKRIEYLSKYHIFKDTSIELKIQEELKNRQIIFEKQKSLLKKYIVDIFIEPNIVIECDGDYWHNRPGAQERDKMRDKNLHNAGYQVYRFWEHEINTSAKICVNKII